MTNAIEIENLKKSYSDRTVLKDINLHVPEAKISLYLGANGAGKTTTMRLIAGLEKTDNGKITLFGQNAQPKMRNEVALTLEEPRFYPWLSGLDNLRVVAAYRNIKKADSWANDVLKQVGLLDAARRSFKSYSLGMRQRLYLASCLIPDLKLLILDEPTNGLDVEGKDQIWDTLSQLRDRGVTLMVSTHQVLEAERYAEHLSVLHDGLISFCGSYEKLASQRRCVIETPMLEQAKEILQSKGLKVELGRQRQSLLSVETGEFDMSSILQLLGDANIVVNTSRPEDLEELYWRMKNVSNPTA